MSAAIFTVNDVLIIMNGDIQQKISQDWWCTFFVFCGARNAGVQLAV